MTILIWMANTVTVFQRKIEFMKLSVPQAFLSQLFQSVCKYFVYSNILSTVTVIFCLQ